MTSPNALTLEVITARAEDEQIAPVNFKQVKLTKKYLLPKIKELQADMLRLRTAFDQSFDVTARKHDKLYPEGFCQEITLGVKTIMEQEFTSAKHLVCWHCATLSLMADWQSVFGAIYATSIFRMRSNLAASMLTLPMTRSLSPNQKSKSCLYPRRECFRSWTMMAMPI
ncbi:MAG: hypothetical protein KTR23_06515 [Rhodospirillales bacterium]|nr:hypothetical protein [Rhodospirillales bacterium]